MKRHIYIVLTTFVFLGLAMSAVADHLHTLPGQLWLHQDEYRVLPGPFGMPNITAHDPTDNRMGRMSSVDGGGGYNDFFVGDLPGSCRSDDPLPPGELVWEECGKTDTLVSPAGYRLQFEAVLLNMDPGLWSYSVDHEFQQNWNVGPGQAGYIYAQWSVQDFARWGVPSESGHQVVSGCWNLTPYDVWWSITVTEPDVAQAPPIIDCWNPVYYVEIDPDTYTIRAGQSSDDSPEALTGVLLLASLPVMWVARRRRDD